MDDGIKLGKMSNIDIFVRLWKAISPRKVVNWVYIAHKGQIYMNSFGAGEEGSIDSNGYAFRVYFKDCIHFLKELLLGSFV